MYAASFIRLRNNISFLFCNRLKKTKTKYDKHKSCVIYSICDHLG